MSVEDTLKRVGTQPEEQGENHNAECHVEVRYSTWSRYIRPMGVIVLCQGLKQDVYK